MTNGRVNPWTTRVKSTTPKAIAVRISRCGVVGGKARTNAARFGFVKWWPCFALVGSKSLFEYPA